MVWVQNEKEYCYDIVNFTIDDIWKTFGDFLLEKDEIIRGKKKESNERTFYYLAKVNPQRFVDVINDLFQNRRDLLGNFIFDEPFSFKFANMHIKVCFEKNIPDRKIVWEMHWESDI